MDADVHLRTHHIVVAHRNVYPDLQLEASGSLWPHPQPALTDRQQAYDEDDGDWKCLQDAATHSEAFAGAE